MKKYIIFAGQIQPLILTRMGQVAPSLSGRASKEITVYTAEDIIEKSSPVQKEIIKELTEIILGLGDNIQGIVGKEAISYKTKQSFICFWPQKNKKGVTVNFPYGYRIEDTKGVLEGRGKQGRYVKIELVEKIPEIIDYIKQAYENSFKI